MLRHALTRRALRPSVSHGRALLSAAASPPASHPSFDLVRSERLAEREADVFFYRHRETGASVMSVAVDDDNKVGSALMLLHSVWRHRRLLPRCHCCASTRITRTGSVPQPHSTHASHRIPHHSNSVLPRAGACGLAWSHHHAQRVAHATSLLVCLSPALRSLSFLSSRSLFPTLRECKVFGVNFRTPPSDDTGVAHILEHSVLCGSRKYPVKEPFVELLKGSMQTFLNAFTYPDRTCYPVASQVSMKV